MALGSRSGTLMAVFLLSKVTRGVGVSEIMEQRAPPTSSFLTLCYTPTLVQRLSLALQANNVHPLHLVSRWQQGSISPNAHCVVGLWIGSTR